jgi:hypothetical protein
VENFHEGWWKPTLSERLLWSLAYLAPMSVSTLMTVLAIRWPRLGALLFAAVGLWFSFKIFSTRWGNIDLVLILSWLPTTVLIAAAGLLWWWGRPEPRRLALTLAIGLPLLTALAFGIEPAWRVAHRVDDGFSGERLVQGNGVELLWAPAGPGWVRDARDACDWNEAMRRAAHLSADGTRLEEQPVNLWRLPTAQEAAASLTRNGMNAGGSWDATSDRASYRITPDKESPLWAVYHETIYWWTSSEAGPDKAWRIVYNGQLHALPRTLRMGTQGFRAVRDP